MVNVLRRFSQPLMVIITVAIIVVFAWWGPNLASGSARRKAVFSAYGKSYSEEDVQRLQNRLLVHLALARGGGMPKFDSYIAVVQPGWFQGQVTSVGVVNAVVFDHESETLGVTATDDEAAQMMKTMPAFLDEQGLFDPDRLDAFARNVMGPYGYTAAQIYEFLEREVRVGKIRDLISATVAVTPEEIRDRYITTQLKTEASYVAFENTDYIKDATVTDEEIQKRYDAQKDVFFKTDEQRTVRFAAFRLPDPEDGKPYEAAKRAQLMNPLVQKAYDLAKQLAAPGANFEELAKAAGATLGETATPFDATNAPEELEESDAAAEAAFTLTKEAPFSKHLILQKGAYVLMLKDIIPAETRKLENVKTEIKAALQFEKASDLARAKAAEVLPKLAEAKKAGKSFYESAESLGLKPVAFPAFSRPQSIPPAPYSAEVTDVTKNLAPGELSGVIPTVKGAIIIHLDQRPPVDESGLEAAKTSTAQQISAQRTMLLFNNWLIERRSAAGLGNLLGEG